MEKKHTPTPWRVLKNKIFTLNGNKNIGTCYRMTTNVRANGTYEDCKEEKANLEFIVEACNNYERLQSENERMRKFLKEIELDYSKEANEYHLMNLPEQSKFWSDKADEINNVLNPK